MNRRATIVLLLVVVLLAGYLVLTRTGTLSIGGEVEEEDTSPDLLPVFEEAASDQVVGFEVTDNETGDRLAAELGEEGWNVTEAPTEPEEGQVVDVGAIDLAVGALGTMVSSRELSELESLTQYGLETARYTLTFRTLGGGEFTLDIGTQTPQGSHYYTQRRGEGEVLLVSTAVLDNFVGFLSEPPYAEPTPTPAPTPTP